MCLKPTVHRRPFDLPYCATVAYSLLKTASSSSWGGSPTSFFNSKYLFLLHEPPPADQFSCVMAILHVIVFLHLLAEAAGQLNSRAVLSTSSLGRLVVSRSTGDVFLADQDTVYLLPGDLSEITSNVSRTAGQTPEGMTLSKQEDKLIVCWASSTLIGGGGMINDAPCVVYNSTDLLQLQTVPGDGLAVGAPRGNPYLVSQGFVEDEGETFYVMSADATRLYHREYRIPGGDRASETPSYEDITDRRYVSGATVGNFSYFATYSFYDGVEVVRVVRVCNMEPNPADFLWDSWYEIQVICDLPTNASIILATDFDNVLVDADFLFPSSGADKPLLVVSVLTDVASFPSAFCAVPMSTIDTSAKNMFDACATTTLNSNQLQFPWESVGGCDTAAVSCVYVMLSVPCVCFVLYHCVVIVIHRGA